MNEVQEAKDSRSKFQLTLELIKQIEELLSLREKSVSSAMNQIRDLDVEMNSLSGSLLRLESVLEIDCQITESRLDGLKNVLQKIKVGTVLFSSFENNFLSLILVFVVKNYICKFWLKFRLLWNSRAETSLSTMKEGS